MTADGKGQVGHAGSALLAGVADRVVLNAGAPARPSSSPRARGASRGTWRQPDMMAFEAFVTARLPSVRVSRARGRGPDAVLGERPHLASRSDP